MRATWQRVIVAVGVSTSTFGFASERPEPPATPRMTHPVHVLMVQGVAGQYHLGNLAVVINLPDRTLAVSSFATSDGKFFIGQESGCFYQGHRYVSENFVLEREWQDESRFYKRYHLAMAGITAAEFFDVIDLLPAVVTVDQVSYRQKRLASEWETIDCRQNVTTNAVSCDLNITATDYLD